VFVQIQNRILTLQRFRPLEQIPVVTKLWRRVNIAVCAPVSSGLRSRTWAECWAGDGNAGAFPEASVSA